MSMMLPQTRPLEDGDQQQGDQQQSKRARVDAGDAGSSGQAYATSSSASSSAGSAVASASSIAAAASAPLPPPLSSLLTQSAPSWIAEVPPFLEAIQQHEPTIPDEVVQYLLERSGCNCPDPKLVRLVSIATQHFLNDVMHDARLYHKIRTGTKDKTNTELTLTDLSSSLSAHGVELSKQEYIADSVFAGGMLNVNAAVTPTQANLHATATNAKDAGKTKKK